MVYRAYFNRHNDYPLVWSVDEGSQDTEVNVMAIIILPSCVVTSHCLDERPNDDNPLAWFEISGNLEIRNDIAYFDR